MRTLARVHWVLHILPVDFHKNYRFVYDYAKHSYLFYRNYRYSVLDCFSVVRTSRKCWRVVYVNCHTCDFQYFSCKSSIKTAEKIYEIYLKNREVTDI